MTTGRINQVDAVDQGPSALRKLGPLRTHVWEVPARAQNSIRRRAQCRVASNGRPRGGASMEPMPRDATAQGTKELRGAMVHVQRSVRHTGAATMHSSGAHACIGRCPCGRSLPARARCGTQEIHANSIGRGTGFRCNCAPGQVYLPTTQLDAHTGHSKGGRQMLTPAQSPCRIRQHSATLTQDESRWIVALHHRHVESDDILPCLQIH